METIEQNNENNIDQLVAKLKTKDSNYANISKALQIIYWIFIPVYGLLSIAEYFSSKDTGILLSGLCFVLSFLIFALFFRRYYKEYKYVDYSLPTIQMLKKAAWRYKPFQGRIIWIFLALILMDIGLTFDWLDHSSIILTQYIFWGMMLLGLVAGLIIWYVRYKPIRDEALKMIREIEKG